MKKILTGVIAIAALLGVSSCSSDKSSSSDTTEAAASDTTVASGDSTVDSAATGDSVAAAGTLQDQAIAILIRTAPAEVTLDEACFTTAMAGLSDEDAQKVIDDTTGNPPLGAAGATLAAAAVQACGTATPTT